MATYRKSPLRLDLSNPIFQSPTRNGRHTGIISRTTSTANMYKAEKTVNLTPQSRRQNARQVSEAFFEASKEVCCPNCRYLFKVHTTPIKHEEQLQRIRNIKSSFAQTQPVIEPLDLSPLMENAQQITAEPIPTTGARFESPTRQAQRTYTKTSLEPVVIPPTERTHYNMSRLASAYDTLLRQYQMLLELLERMRQRTDTPSYMKYLGSDPIDTIPVLTH